MVAGSSWMRSSSGSKERAGPYPLSCMKNASISIQQTRINDNRRRTLWKIVAFGNDQKWYRALWKSSMQFRWWFSALRPYADQLVAKQNQPQAVAAKILPSSQNSEKIKEGGGSRGFSFHEMRKVWEQFKKRSACHCKQAILIRDFGRLLLIGGLTLMGANLMAKTLCCWFHSGARGWSLSQQILIMTALRSRYKPWADLANHELNEYSKKPAMILVGQALRKKRKQAILLILSRVYANRSDIRWRAIESFCSLSLTWNQLVFPPSKNGKNCQGLI